MQIKTYLQILSVTTQIFFGIYPRNILVPSYTFVLYVCTPYQLYICSIPITLHLLLFLHKLC